MASSGRTAKRLAAGPTLLLAAEVSDEAGQIATVLGFLDKVSG